MKNDEDIIVLGSGIAGSIVALILRRLGMRVLVVERKTHPRFAIGESTVPTTTLLLGHLAKTYGVPELGQVAHYVGLRTNGCTAWPKQHFWYASHRPGEPLPRGHEQLFEGLLLPVGPEVHMLRADADAFLVGAYPKYGVEYVEETELVDLSAEPNRVTVRLRGPGGEERDVTANLVVDATGHASFLAKRYGLRDDPPALETNTRSIFGHFTGVADLDEVLGGVNPAFRFRRTAGTMHHCFRGGWIWVIPFDNGVTSVGAQLDRRIYPLDPSVTAEQELAALFARYPSVEAHFRGMTPVRPLVRTDRVQFTSKTILGDGFILTPHAAAFIEPLFSTGILLTVAFAARFARAAKAAHVAKDWNVERFRSLDAHFQAEVKHIDHLVDGMIQSFRDRDLFKQYWRNWVIGTFGQWCTSVTSNGVPRDVPMLYGSAIPGFAEELAAAHAIVRRDDADPAALARELQQRADAWWAKVCDPVILGHGGVGLQATESLCVRNAGRPDLLLARLLRFAEEMRAVDRSFDPRHAERWMEASGALLGAQQAEYHRSKSEGGAFALAYDRIFDAENAETFDYRAAIGLPARANEPS